MRGFSSGGGPTDALEVRSHPFFSSVNWDDLLRKNIPAPFIPKIQSETDVSNFSDEFTNMEAVDTPGVVPQGAEMVKTHFFGNGRGHVFTLTFLSQAFKGYSFISPSILFAENNVISDEVFRRRPNPDKKPSASNLVCCILQVRPV